MIMNIRQTFTIMNPEVSGFTQRAQKEQGWLFCTAWLWFPAPFPTPALPERCVLSVHLQQRVGSWRLGLAENICFLSDRSDVCSMRDRL